MTMDTEQIKELDRNMDSVFDNLFALNATVNALVKSLSPEVADRFVRQMDEKLGSLETEYKVMGFAGHQQLQAWRNMAAQNCTPEEIEQET